MKKTFKKYIPIIFGLALLVGLATAAFPDDKPAAAPAMGGSTTAAPAPAAATAPAAAPAASEPQGDPSGVNTGVAADAVGEAPNSPTADDLTKLGKTEPLALKLADSVGHNRIAINIVWTWSPASWSCSCRPGSPWWRPASPGPRTPPTPWR